MRAALLIKVSNEEIEFEFLQKLYERDEDFGSLWAKHLVKQLMDDFLVHDGFFV